MTPIFPPPRSRWILEHVEGARRGRRRGELLFGTVETWLIWKLTKGKVHVTDYSNASRTMLFNINTLEWDRGDPGAIWISRPAMLPGSQSLPAVSTAWRTPHILAGRFPLPEPRETSSPRCLARPALRRERRKILTGPAVSYADEYRRESRCFREHGLVTTIAWGMDGKVTLCAGGLHLSWRGGDPVAAG